MRSALEGWPSSRIARASGSGCRSRVTMRRRSRSPRASFGRSDSSPSSWAGLPWASTWCPARRSEASTRRPRFDRSPAACAEGRVTAPSTISGTPSALAERLSRRLHRFIEVRPHEVPIVAWCWLYIFSVLSSYYIMRPIRDQAGVAGGVNTLQWLFTGTLVAMLLLNIPFAYLVKSLPRRRFIPITYHFFAANILLFAVLFHWSDGVQTVWVGRMFFIWVSAFNLFVVSVFWQLNVDLFSPEQG